MSFFSKLVNTDNSELTKEQKQKNKQIDKKLKQLNNLKYNNKKVLSAVEIENPYFGNGILAKDISSENICYIDIISGFDKIFDYFCNNSEITCDLYEFLVREDNIDYVLTSLEKIYNNFEQITEECYTEIYKEIIKFFEEGESLKDDFSLEYLKENWYVFGVAIYDDHVKFSIGIDAAENREDDSAYDINISVNYATQKAELSFDIVW